MDIAKNVFLNRVFVTRPDVRLAAYGQPFNVSDLFATASQGKNTEGSITVWGQAWFFYDLNKLPATFTQRKSLSPAGELFSMPDPAAAASARLQQERRAAIEQLFYPMGGVAIVSSPVIHSITATWMADNNLVMTNTRTNVDQ
jgi:hypothetical protein